MKTLLHSEVIITRQQIRSPITMEYRTPFTFAILLHTGQRWPISLEKIESAT